MAPADHLASKSVIGESMAQKAPLFVSIQFHRLCLRRVQEIFAHWQEVARFARHANPITTVAYTHPSDEELYAQIGQL